MLKILRNSLAKSEEEGKTSLYEHGVIAASLAKIFVETSGKIKNRELRIFTSFIHDVGKLDPMFQKFLRGELNKKPPIKHSKRKNIEKWLSHVLKDPTLPSFIRKVQEFLPMKIPENEEEIEEVLDLSQHHFFADERFRPNNELGEEPLEELRAKYSLFEAVLVDTTDIIASIVHKGLYGSIEDTKIGPYCAQLGIPRPHLIKIERKIPQIPQQNLLGHLILSREIMKIYDEILRESKAYFITDKITRTSYQTYYIKKGDVNLEEVKQKAKSKWEEKIEDLLLGEEIGKVGNLFKVSSNPKSNAPLPIGFLPDKYEQKLWKKFETWINKLEAQGKTDKMILDTIDWAKNYNIEVQKKEKFRRKEENLINIVLNVFVNGVPLFEKHVGGKQCDICGRSPAKPIKGILAGPGGKKFSKSQEKRGTLNQAIACDECFLASWLETKIVGLAYVGRKIPNKRNAIIVYHYGIHNDEEISKINEEIAKISRESIDDTIRDLESKFKGEKLEKAKLLKFFASGRRGRELAPNIINISRNPALLQSMFILPEERSEVDSKLRTTVQGALAVIAMAHKFLGGGAYAVDEIPEDISDYIKTPWGTEDVNTILRVSNALLFVAEIENLGLRQIFSTGIDNIVVRRIMLAYNIAKNPEETINHLLRDAIRNRLKIKDFGNKFMQFLNLCEKYVKEGRI